MYPDAHLEENKSARGGHKSFFDSKELMQKSRNPNNQEAAFIRDQARLPRAEAMFQKDEQLVRQVVEMPERFATKFDYVEKLKELLLIEAECDRVSTEVVAEPDVYFQFEECLKIYSRLLL